MYNNYYNAKITKYSVPQKILQRNNLYQLQLREIQQSRRKKYHTTVIPEGR